jgi:hypothetical protein
VQGGGFINVAVGRRHLYVGNGDFNEILQFDALGRATRRFRLDRGRLPLDSDARRDYEQLGGPCTPLAESIACAADIFSGAARGRRPATVVD